jgi:hypothetical protein
VLVLVSSIAKERAISFAELTPKQILPKEVVMVLVCGGCGFGDNKALDDILSPTSISPGAQAQLNSTELNSPSETIAYSTTAAAVLFWCNPPSTYNTGYGDMYGIL